MILTQLQVLLLVNNDNAYELDKCFRHAKQCIERLRQCRMSKTRIMIQRLMGNLSTIVT